MKWEEMGWHEPKEKEVFLMHDKKNQGSTTEGPSSLLLLGVNERVSSHRSSAGKSHWGGSWSVTMLSRPKPGESEVDLLQFQSQFLAAGATPAVQLVKKGSRRGGSANPDQPLRQDHRDVVMLDSEWLRVFG